MKQRTSIPKLHEVPVPRRIVAKRASTESTTSAKRLKRSHVTGPAASRPLPSLSRTKSP
jgi:hypothetical protein